MFGRATITLGKKYCVVRHVRNTIFFWKKNNVLWQVCHNTLFFEPQHIIFLKKILCCGKFVTTHYFSRDIVL